MIEAIMMLALGQDVVFTDRQRRIIDRMSPPPALPMDTTNRVADSADAASLGARLFKTRSFSTSGTVSCATCHVPWEGFDDGRALAKGEAQGTRNTPTLLGAPHQRWFFWDGRADSLWAQALHPFETPAEFAGARTDAVRTVHDTSDLRAAYTQVFGPLPPMDDLDRFPAGARPGTNAWDGMTPIDQYAITEAFVHLGKAIAAFERTIPLGTSKFDRWVAAGQPADSGLTTQERRGLELFIGTAQCRNCHGGPLFTDRAFHNIGLPEPDGSLPSDPGRSAGLAAAKANEFRAGGQWSDDPKGPIARRAATARDGPEHWGAFRTPSLRNLQATAPYMHDGRFATLSDVLAFYNTLETQVRLDHHQEQVLQPLQLPPADLAAIEAFLRTLHDGPETPVDAP